MKFVFKINVNNDAFYPDPDLEVARLLRKAADRVDAGENLINLQDINGHTVGEAKYIR